MGWNVGVVGVDGEEPELPTMAQPSTSRSNVLVTSASVAVITTIPSLDVSTPFDMVYRNSAYYSGIDKLSGSTTRMIEQVTREVTLAFSGDPPKGVRTNTMRFLEPVTVVGTVVIGDAARLGSYLPPTSHCQYAMPGQQSMSAELARAPIVAENIGKLVQVAVLGERGDGELQLLCGVSSTLLDDDRDVSEQVSSRGLPVRRQG